MTETAVFGGGCFWCTEAIFQRLKGVESVVPGYAGGDKEDPSYEEVSGSGTGHAEVIKIVFDPDEIKFDDLLDVFFATHDPTTMNRQGNDEGPQYRSVVLYNTPDQKRAVEEKIKNLTAKKEYERPIITEIQPLDKFYEAEEYHHDYYNKNQSSQYCQVIISPKLEKLKKKFSRLVTD